MFAVIQSYFTKLLDIRVQDKGKMLKQQITDKLCLNPQCTLSFERVFASDHQHNNLTNCSNWIIDFQQLEQLHGEPNPQIIINLKHKHIRQNISSLTQLSMTNWQLYFQEQQRIMIENITQQITNVYNEIKASISNINAEQLYAAFRELVKKQNHEEVQSCIERIVQLYIRPLFNKEIKLLFIGEPTLYIPEAFKTSMKNNYYVEDSERMQHNLISLQESQKFQNFIFSNDLSDAFNKIQQISSMCSIRSTDFTFKQKIVNLKCPFCDTNFFKDSPNNLLHNANKSQKKTIKKQVSIKVLNHLCEEHYQTIFQNYQNKILQQWLPYIYL